MCRLSVHCAWNGGTLQIGFQSCHNCILMFTGNANCTRAIFAASVYFHPSPIDHTHIFVCDGLVPRLHTYLVCDGLVPRLHTYLVCDGLVPRLHTYLVCDGLVPRLHTYLDIMCVAKQVPAEGVKGVHGLLH